MPDELAVDAKIHVTVSHRVVGNVKLLLLRTIKILALLDAEEKT